jgi:hydroxymethylglutaryl-CoA reductase
MGPTVDRSRGAPPRVRLALHGEHAMSQPPNRVPTSELPGFYRLDRAIRRERAAESAGLPSRELDALVPASGLSEEQADHMVENALGVFGLPLGLCVNLRVDGVDHLVPMVVEEPSVVAACSYASKLLRASGGVVSERTEPLMIGQIQLLDVADLEGATSRILAARDELVARANDGHPGLVGAGGGARDVEVRVLEPLGFDDTEGLGDPCGAMLVVHLVVDARDAMGANAINTMCERLAPRVAELAGGRAALRILSNLTDKRLVTVRGRVPVELLESKGSSEGQARSGLVLARAIEEASVFAERDPYRAATHNKGIMNGIDAALIAFGQDFRAIEAGAHAFAARRGRYTALARWRVEGDALIGRMTIPMAVGTVGGIVNVHPTVRANRKLARIDSTGQLASVIAAVGLAQNLSALRALAAEGIQHGHMRLHARNIAIEAGASGDEIALVAEGVADRGHVTLGAAREALAELRARRG